ncbi:endonuclease/exonuclease/phosphatase family protein [Nocardioides jishulii]|nr:endonuclease/exonuclease/phosphatase family protein [Nocardioides jishulii]
MVRHLPRLRTWLLLAVVLLLVGAAALVPRGDTGEQPTAALSSGEPTVQPPGTTSFRIASFNLLGAGHTDGKNPKRKGWANSAQRLKWSRQILDQQKVDVVGFQEMHASQVQQWPVNNPDFESWPLHKYSHAVGHNTISWRTSVFKMVKAKTIMIPYFNGVEQRMPYVLLEHIASGQRMWLYNVHTPANIGGNHQKWRDIGFKRAIELANTLRTEDPNVPVFMTGDMNDREKFFCPTAAGTDLVAANGGYASGSTCVPPKPIQIDWIMGSPPVTFTDYASVRTPLVKKTTDHPVVVATANTPSRAVQQSSISRVVVVTAEGLRASTSSQMAKRGELPQVATLRDSGSHTFNARTAVESAAPLPNLLSLLTGRPVAKANAGHGVNKNKWKGTVHRASGRYVPSVFDRVHDSGRRTALFASSSVVAPIRLSYNAKNGALDPYGKNNGRRKIDGYKIAGSDRKAVKAFRDSKKPAAYTHIHLSAPRAAGEKHGFGSAKYRKAVRQFDRNLAMVRRTINTAPAYRGKTLLVVTATGGGDKRSGTDRLAPQTYKVPLFVTGPGIPAGQSLYTMNPAWLWPAGDRVAYSRRPITTGVVGNLSLAALRLPALGGSTLNPAQDFNVLQLPTTASTPSPAPAR